MALPRKLKNMNLFDEGESFHGQVDEVTLPKLSRKMEEYRAGGMNAPVEIDHGQELMTAEVVCGGIMESILKQWGSMKADGIGLRFAGSYQREDTGLEEQVEVVMRGRWKEVDMAGAKVGDDTKHKHMATLAYYRLSIAGQEIIEIDVLGMVERVNGVDLMAERRKNIGL